MDGRHAIADARTNHRGNRAKRRSERNVRRRSTVADAYAANWDLVELPLDGGPIRDLLATVRIECCAVSVPGTTKFAYLTNRSGLPEIRVRDHVDHSERVGASTRDFRANSASARVDIGAVSRDGESLAFIEYSSDGYAIWITPIAGGMPVRLTRSREPRETAPSWSPDGKWISFLAKYGGAPTLMRVRVGGADEPAVILRGGADESTTWCCVPQWSPAGDWIAFASNRGIKLIRPDGTAQRVLSPLTKSR